MLVEGKNVHLTTIKRKIFPKNARRSPGYVGDSNPHQCIRFRVRSGATQYIEWFLGMFEHLLKNNDIKPSASQRFQVINRWKIPCTLFRSGGLGSNPQTDKPTLAAARVQLPLPLP